MNLNLYIIKKELEEEISFESHLIDPPGILPCTYPVFRPGVFSFTEGPIYIVKGTEISGHEEFEGHPSLIVLGTLPTAFLNRKCNFLYYQQEIDPLYLLNRIQQIFYQYYEWESRMQKIVDEGRPIREIGSISFPFFQNPMLLQGANFQGIFQILPKPPSNASALYREYYDTYCLKENDYMNLDEINILITDDEYNQSASTSEPTIYSGEKYGFRSLFYNIRVNGIVVARLLIDEIMHDFTDSDFALIKVLGSFLEKALRRQDQEAFQRTRNLDEILVDLLQHRLVAETRIVGALKNLGWEMKDSYFCILMVTQVKHRENVLNALAFQLIPYLPPNCYTVFDNQILVLFNLSKLKDTREHVISKCPSLLRDNLLKAGISTEFYDFKDLYYYYLQAQSSLKLGQRENPSFWYYRFEDYNLRYLVEKSAENQIGNALIPNGLKMLIHYDEQKGTTYTELLRTFLECNMNIAKTIRKSYLHRNTFLYRIGKIKEISQLDLENNDVRLHLQLAYKILDLKTEKS